MLSLNPSRLFGKVLSPSFPGPILLRERSKAKADVAVREPTWLLTLGWLSAGFGAVAVGLFVGRELRQRYQFNRRTPYDFYAHSGDERQDLEFGLGI